MEAFHHAQGAATAFIRRLAQQRTQVATAFSAIAGHAAARYDFNCPPSSLSQTIRCFFKSTTGGLSNLRPADRRCPAPVGKALPKPPPLSHRLLTGGSSFFETRNSTRRLTQKCSRLLTQLCRVRIGLRPKSSHRKGLELAKSMPSNRLRIEKKRVLLRRGFLSGSSLILRTSVSRPVNKRNRRPQTSGFSRFIRHF